MAVPQPTDCFLLQQNSLLLALPPSDSSAPARRPCGMMWGGGRCFCRRPGSLASPGPAPRVCMGTSAGFFCKEGGDTLSTKTFSIHIACPLLCSFLLPSPTQTHRVPRSPAPHSPSFAKCPALPSDWEVQTLGPEHLAVPFLGNGSRDRIASFAARADFWGWRGCISSCRSA